MSCLFQLIDFGRVKVVASIRKRLFSDTIRDAVNRRFNPGTGHVFKVRHRPFERTRIRHECLGERVGRMLFD